MLGLEEATKVFGHGFATVRSQVSPREYVCLGRLSAIRDVPGIRKVDKRNPEVIAVGLTPNEILAELKSRIEGRYFLCFIAGMVGETLKTKNELKLFGFRALRSEPFFVREVGNEPAFEQPLVIRQVLTQDDLDRIRRTSGKKGLLLEQLHKESPTHRIFVAIENDEAVGYVTSVPTFNNMNWVSSLYVANSYRRRGIGAALMKTMLANDSHHGVKNSVLVSSRQGARLYPKLGYEQIGTLHMFSPPKPRT